MRKLFDNKTVASSLGFVILVSLVWLVGPYLGLPSEQSRLYLIVGILLLWVFLLLLGRVLAERAGRMLDKMLRRQADEAVIGASTDQRREVAQIRQRLLAAIDKLNSSELGKRAGKAALYELPWYMVIGHSAAGKSTAICQSGLNFPYGDGQPVTGVSGTRNCDWFFSSEGVLLDTAGRYSTAREDRGEWLEFLKLLKKHRARAPVNGILVALSYTELMGRNQEQTILYAKQIRERIDEIDNAFAASMPVYLVLTKMDLVAGFSEFFEDIPPEERHAVWGATLSHDQESGFDAARVVGQQFDVLQRGLVQMGLDRLANNRGNVRRPALFAFPIEFNSLREPLCKFVEMLFQHDPYHSKPLLRGFYFTSAIQEGRPQALAGERITRVFDLEEKNVDVVPPSKADGYFLQSLFREVLFPDCHLVTRQTKPAAARWRVAGMAAGLIALAVCSGLLTWSFVGNQKLLSTAQEELLVARQLARSNELVDRLKGLQVLQLRIEQLYQYQQQGHPFRLGVGLYQGSEIERVLRLEYFAGVRELMLAPVKLALENTLAGLGSVPASLPPVARPQPAEPPKKVRPPQPSQSDGELPFIPIGYRLPEGGATRGFVVPAAMRHDAGGVRVIRTQLNSTTLGKDRPRSSIVGLSQGESRLEDSYNALKTYLMLKHKERMDVPHLSDQIPKYWLPWLSEHGGNGDKSEINRMAERVVAFYLSQISSDDLPLIDNREDLVGSSREVLRTSFKQLSAVERVYNELKARANTQFAPMTVGRILNSRDLDVVVGSTTVAGAFTREAWEKYFRGAIADAAGGTIKGDDWVLATSSLDDLGKGGNSEANRAALESLYKEEFAREWKKFLQGVAIQDFGTLENTVQALGKLSDLQNSAIRQILTIAAQETSWDNPSRISRSIESAKSSVIERTEKLIRGNTTGTAAVERGYGEIGGKFSQLQDLVRAGEGGRMPLSAYLEMLSKLKGRLAQLASSSDAGAASRSLMQATLNSSGSEFAEALALVDGSLLASASEEAKEAVRPLLVRPLIQAYSALIPLVEQDINRKWRAEVLSSWRSLSGKYPFADSANEAPMSEIAKFLKPGEGTLAKFVDTTLAGLVVRRGEQFVPRTWANLGIGFNPAFLSGVSALSAVGSSVLQEGDAARFELQPFPTPGLSEILIEVDGQVLRYRNGPQLWTGFNWPNAQASVQGARLQVVSFAGVSTSMANHGGRLGLMRLLTQARVEDRGNGSATLEWRQESGGGGKVNGVVRFNFRLVSGANPLSLSGLRRLSLPERVTIRGN
ncbi:type VI secretion system membrane subunit TssM [Propionivibrio sp.]|uniref:type VI secretion system membrane subunit TssM n=1 Tax=Propionivibrio sp. TaxID=2212460 RepID=UPI00272E8D67|nr:type VI secretion system membrane subunit TssM [Propionivibrio sp.]